MWTSSGISSVKLKQIRATGGSLARAGARLGGFPVVVLFLLAVAACGVEYPQSSLNPHSDFAQIIHSLYVSIFWWTMLILAVVWIALAYVLVRFRGKPGDPQPRQIRGHMGLEIGWTVGPALIVIAIAIPTIQAVFATQRPISEDALLVEVTGHRFWWEFHYPEQGVTTANELWLPVDRPVSLRLAASDVIHSFWVPLLGGKRDLNPTVAVREGQEPHYTWIFLTPESTGVFMGQCAEYCGEAHALMGLRVVVESEEGFEDWVTRWTTGAEMPVGADQPASPSGDIQLPGQDPAPDVPTLPVGAPSEDPLVVMGRDVFLNQSTCVACHAIEGTSAQGQVGPNLTLFGARTTVGAGLMENTQENLAHWIRDPRGLKPGAEMPGTDYAMQVPRARGQIYSWPATGLTDDQVDAVAAYLLSLQ